MPKLPDVQPVLDAAMRWRKRCLIDDGSVLSDEALWTADNLGQLVEYYIEKPDLGDRDFFAKLKDQLEETTPAVNRLAAELLWALYLFPSTSSMRHVTKRQQIRRVWGWGGTSLPEEHPELGEPLSIGIGGTGTGFNTHRWREFEYIILFARDVKRTPPAERTGFFDDPWRFAAWLETNDRSAGRQFRHILVYLFFPDEFEPIATGGPKRKIVRALGKDAGVEDVDLKNRIEVDRAIRTIRLRLEADRGEAFNFYSPELRELWFGPAPENGQTAGPPDSRSRLYGTAEEVEWVKQRFGDHAVWLIAAGDGGALWDDFRREGIITIGWDDLGDLRRYESRDTITAELKALAGGEGARTNDSLACWQFAHEMRIGDTIIAKRGRRELLGLGTVTSDYRYEPDREEHRHVRSVEWAHTGQWTLPEHRRFALKTLTDFTRYADWLYEAVRIVEGEPGTHKVSRARAPAYSLSDALVDLFMPPELFERILDTFERKRNLILEGPPGVGKTFVAKRVAWALMGERDSSRVLTVQFHQSYSYEDFIQGWRPSKEGFELRNGVFHQFCTRATSDPDNRYVFVIDEINRGNLSRILGEVMLLIEADKRGPSWAMPLTYATSHDDRFHVPANVFVLGLMNTADRSLALVDYALRRRFAFVKIDPCFGTDAFNAFFEDRAQSEIGARIAERMIALNERIQQDRRNLGPGFEIGHSFFVPGEDEDIGPEWYERIIRTEVEPLLREYWFDHQERVDEAVNELLRE